jgi:hypothetical protein
MKKQKNYKILKSGIIGQDRTNTCAAIMEERLVAPRSSEI